MNGLCSLSGLASGTARSCSKRWAFNYSVLLDKFPAARFVGQNLAVQARCRHTSLATGHDAPARTKHILAETAAYSDTVQAIKLLKPYLRPEADKQALYAAIKAVLSAKDANLRLKDTDLRLKDAELRAKDAELRAKDAELRAKDAELRAKDAGLSAKDSELRVSQLKLHIATSDWLKLRGRFSMRGVMEHIQNNMRARAGFYFDEDKPGASWAKYVKEQSDLRTCLKEVAGVDIQAVEVELPEMYSVLSRDTYDRNQLFGYKLVIGYPLNQRQQLIMTCLCRDLDVAFEDVQGNSIV